MGRNYLVFVALWLITMLVIDFITKNYFMAILVVCCLAGLVLTSKE